MHNLYPRLDELAIPLKPHSRGASSFISWDMEVIDITSSESDDDGWEDDEDLEEDINRLLPNYLPTVNAETDSNFDLHSREYTHKSFAQPTYSGSNPDMGNREIEPSTGGRSIPPLKPTVHAENGSEQDAGDISNYMWKDGVNSSKEHIKRRTLPPSLLPHVIPNAGVHRSINQINNGSWQGNGKHLKDSLMASQGTMYPGGDADVKYGVSAIDGSKCEAKHSTDSKQKRILPSSLQPTISKFVPKAYLENNGDIQVLGFHQKMGSFEDGKVTKLVNPSFSVKDNIDRQNDRQIYENAGAHRQLPPWMSGESASRKFAISSVMSSSPIYSDSTGDLSGFGERSMEEDERLIFQAALQDLSQPKHEIDLPPGRLTVPLLRHQRIALAWMQRKEGSSYCSGGILADDQGLGKTISVIALIQMERPHQEQFSSSLSSYIRSDALNLDEADGDHILPEDKKTGHFEENLGKRTQKSNLPANHSGHTAFKVLNLVEIDDEHHILDRHVGEDLETVAVKSETCALDKLERRSPKKKETDHSSECDSSKKVQAKNSVKSTMHKGRPAGGTLIVCPASILRQWARELDEKVPEDNKLSVLVYHGSSRLKDPSSLAKYDVVLTTYSIVTNEVPKQPLNVDDDEQKNIENYSLSSDFCVQRKRKKTSDVHKRGKKKNEACDSSFDYDSGPLSRVRWFRVVLDEAQTIKNFRTQVSRACCGLRAKRRWCLSGTPLQNALDDLYSYFRFLKYDPYAVYSSFCSTIKNPITRNATIGYKKLQAVLRTVMLRRTKGTLIDGEPIIKIPPKEICLKKIYFSPEEREFYSNLEADSRQKFKAFAAAGTVNENYASILALLLRLRQACDHPLLVKGYHSVPVASASLRRAQQLPREMLICLLNRLEASLTICGICSDQPEDAVVTMCGHVFCYQCISGHLTGDDNLCPAASCKDILDADSVFSGATLRKSMSGEPAEDSSGVVKHLKPSFHSSSKIEAAMDILKSICRGQCPEASGERCDERFPSAHGSSMTSSEVDTIGTDAVAKTSETEPSKLPIELPIKAIVFSQWTSMLDLLEISLNDTLLQYRRLDGTMSLSSRDRAVRDFNSDPEVTVMLMSLKAGNLGLNMIAACHVILLDPWWNPTTEDQAIDRAHRIGQIRPVTVSRLTVSGTVEDRILLLQLKKREMVSSAFGEDQVAGRATRLTAEDLRYLFNL